ncbi:MAG: hypothetical protein Q7S00_04395, partial [bacterium]|nr:hypothetical protein [bacterium]
TFLEHGIKPILLERGERTKERTRKVSHYWRTGEVDADSNVCNGEGGAGTFSDGKLITRIKSPYISRVMQTFVDYGAPEEIGYVYNPHVGSNMIRKVVSRMNDDLIARGGDMRFNARVASLDLSGRDVQGVVLANGERVAGTGVILACGHSARSFFHTLRDQGVHCDPKPFALGLRIEHPQSYINAWQYGKNCQDLDLGAAEYKVAYHWDRENIGVYSFCMCPGGYVVPSATEPDGIVVNGMSNYQRNSLWANAAIVCSVPVERIQGEDSFRLIRFQEEIEQKAYQMSHALGDPKKIPAQRLDDFFEKRLGKKPLRSSSLSGVVSANVAELLPDWIYDHLVEGIRTINKRRKGFATPDAVLHAVESRTSSALRFTRDPESFESLNTNGLFPCGEGAGYAGGITSAAIDGINSTLAWIRKFGTS